MDIVAWRARAGRGANAPIAPAPEIDVPVFARADAGWEALQARVRVCNACRLHAGRTQTVFGVGDPHAQWMVIGEGPGADEDQQGEPFVGKAGQLLNAMLAAIGLARGKVYIANIVKCRPPQNREPASDEVAACMGYLHAQIDLVQPRIILCVGKVAASNLLGRDEPIGRMRGTVHQFKKIPTVVTYHPAYLLRSPLEKRKAWEDLKLARRVVQQGL
ncbi:MAG: uracil-DNA glycosylase [Pseudomonadota bacterium]